MVKSMKLPEDLFEAIVGCNSLRVEHSRGSDRRTLGRVRLPARVQVIPMSKNLPGKPISVTVRDMSQEGIGLLLPARLAEGDNLLVRLPAKQSTTWVLCVIARVERVAEGLYVTGATFVRLVEPAASSHATARLNH